MKKKLYSKSIKPLKRPFNHSENTFFCIGRKSTSRKKNKKKKHKYSVVNFFQGKIQPCKLFLQAWEKP